MSNPTPPQQPNRPEGLREILNILVTTKYDTIDDKLTVVDETLAAIRTRIERAIPSKSHKAQRAYRIESSDFAAVVKEKERNKAIDEFKSNIERELGT